MNKLYLKKNRKSCNSIEFYQKENAVEKERNKTKVTTIKVQNLMLDNHRNIQSKIYV